MSDPLEFYCWILGDNPHHVFLVKVASSDTVAHLQKTIKNKKSSDILKVNINLVIESDLLRTIKVKSVIPGDQLKLWTPLSEVFLGRVEDKHLYIIMHSDNLEQPPARPSCVHSLNLGPNTNLLALHKTFWCHEEHLLGKQSIPIPDQLSLEVEDGSQPLNLTIIMNPEGIFCFRQPKLLIVKISKTFWELLQDEDKKWQELVNLASVISSYLCPACFTLNFVLAGWLLLPHWIKDIDPISLMSTKPQARICCMPTWPWGPMYFGSLLFTDKAYEPLDNDHCTWLRKAYSIFDGILQLYYQALLEDGLQDQLILVDEALGNIESLDNFIWATKGQLPFHSSTSYTLLSKTLMKHLADPDTRGKVGILFEHAAHFTIRKAIMLNMIHLSVSMRSRFMVKKVYMTIPAVRNTEKSHYYSLDIWENPGSQNVHPDFLNLYMTPVIKQSLPSMDCLFHPGTPHTSFK
ncbi:hypothetical protein PILCRDRAFT_93764 [Piloderma croceum F 1598]|uniref:Crinkler effector protein N-terminal domain-containing protein n=1 Tax=Piloderma croceum (strain F 1598) TaxID=765440 RepID=A0A0C3EG97_PILCF|nr:hypothetical protein PILCRDRAFT_93764 [Piloderma croceum F 1598]